MNSDNIIEPMNNWVPKFFDNDELNLDNYGEKDLLSSILE